MPIVFLWDVGVDVFAELVDGGGYCSQLPGLLQLLGLAVVVPVLLGRLVIAHRLDQPRDRNLSSVVCYYSIPN